MIKLDRPLAFIDLETTGVDPVKDRIVQFAAFIRYPDRESSRWASYINPMIPIPAEATAVHGITDDLVATAPRFSEKAAMLHKALSGKDLGGYNIRRFDLPMLDEEFRRCGLRLDLSGVRVIDAQVIFHKRESRTLADAVRKYCQVELEGAHEAQQDAEAVGMVLDGQLLAYPDLAEMDLEKLSEYCLSDPERKPADVAGKLYYDKGGDLCYGFGKHVGKKVGEHADYAGWMLSKGDFPGSTIECLERELNRERGSHGV